MGIQITIKEKLDNSYKIFIQEGIANFVPEFLKKNPLGNKYAIIVDSKVKKLYGDAFLRFLRKNQIKAEIFEFPDGEIAKTYFTINELGEELSDKGFDRTDAIIALGGGVTGDIAGFFASTYMRGIPYIQIPTTLLAMVDSSIGGKTGINLLAGKNLLGTFYQPKAVFIDPNYLKTLPATQIKNGLAEIIKYGVIRDKELFNFIEQNIGRILKLDKTALLKIIKRSIEIKAEIVQKDEKENRIRMLLNYGHTFGHVIEKLSDYKLLHGYAISIGMILANKLAMEKKLFKKANAERIKNLLMAAGLPVATMKIMTLKQLATDKKKNGDVINFVLPKEIGKAVIYPVKLPNANS